MSNNSTALKELSVKRFKTMLETDFPNTASKKDCKALFPSGLLSVNSFLKIESLQGSNKAVGLGR